MRTYGTYLFHTLEENKLIQGCSVVNVKAHAQVSHKCKKLLFICCKLRCNGPFHKEKEKEEEATTKWWRGIKTSAHGTQSPVAASTNYLFTKCA